MRYLPLTLSLGLMLAPVPALAQDEEGGFFSRLFGTDEATSDEEQGGLLETFIEDNLSGDGRTVSITGFEGALSGRATLETLTISDDDGVWLSLTDVVLDWSRAALFRGALEVNELTAGVIELPRLPAPAEGEAPTPEAQGFSLPELPVSVNIGQIAAERVEIGQPVFGTAASVSVEGTLSLADGEGAAELAISKLDEQGGLTLDASYSNASEVLALDLDVIEGPDGILAGLLDLPGRPSLEFQISGEAPVTEYAADIRLATDGQERLTGRIQTRQVADEEALRIAADLSGDIAPIFSTDYQPFFGPDVALSAVATTFNDGRLVVSDLNVSARSLTLTGAAEIGADGLPDRIALEGAVRAPDGPVLLPLSGPETRVDDVTLDVSFDADEGDLWTGTFDIAGLDRPGFSAAAISLDGQGRIVSTGTRAVTATLDFDATRLDLGDPAAAEAMGERVEGALDIAWEDGGPIRLSDLSITGESYGLTGEADIAMRDEGGPEIDGNATVRADRLDVFSGIAARQLGGRAELSTTFNAQPLAGLFDVSAEGSTTDLIVSQPEADRILAGEAQMALTASRDENGIRVVLEEIETPNASLTGQATLRSGGSSLSVSGSLADAALVLPSVSGPVRLTASATEDENRVWEWSTNAALEGTRLVAEGTALDVYDTPVIAASGRLEVDDLSDYAELAQRPISGAIATNFSGELVADLSRANATLNGSITNVTTGIAEADTLLAGTVQIALDAAMAGTVYSLNSSSIEGPEISLTANGALVPNAGRFEVSGRLTDAAKVLPGAPSEPFTFSATGDQDGRDWAVTARANGAGLSADIEGVALDPFATPLSTAGFDGRVSADIEDLAVLSDLANRPLRGSIALDAEGNLTTDLSSFDVQANVSGNGLSIGQAEADRLLAGNLVADIDAARMGDTIDIRTLTLDTDLLDVSATGGLGNGGTIDLDARLAEVSSFVSGISGPISVTGSVGQREDAYTVDIRADGAGGIDATVAGSAAADFSTVDLDIDGSAPLALADQFIAPRSVAGTVGFDLRLSGPPALSSLSGVVSTSGARLVAPTLLLALNDISSTIRLNGESAQISLTGSIENGGAVSIEGPVGLTAPFNADLGIALNDVVLTDPRIYETSVGGRISVAGPLTGGARIAGALSLGETNIRIPSSSLGGAGAVPEIIHLNETPPIRATRRRAGFIETGSSDASSGPAYPLDIRVSAPNRLFVRGRGLDSEFGGSLRITGTSNNVIPIGAFNLVRGRLDILGQRLVIEEAAITIQGDFVPILQIRATTTAEEYTIAVGVTGPASDPEITFTSEPDLPQEEVLARLIFGRGLDTLSPIQAARLALAVRTLAGQGGEGIVGNIRQGAGLADLDLTTDEEGNTAVRAGAYIGENVYTDVTVGSGGETELNLNLDVSRSVTLKGSVTNEGDTSVGIFFERDY